MHRAAAAGGADHSRSRNSVRALSGVVAEPKEPRLQLGPAARVVHTRERARVSLLPTADEQLGRTTVPLKRSLGCFCILSAWGFRNCVMPSALLPQGRREARLRCCAQIDSPASHYWVLFFVLYLLILHRGLASAAPLVH